MTDPELSPADELDRRARAAWRATKGQLPSDFAARVQAATEQVSQGDGPQAADRARPVGPVPSGGVLWWGVALAASIAVAAVGLAVASGFDPRAGLSGLVSSAPETWVTLSAFL